MMVLHSQQEHHTADGESDPSKGTGGTVPNERSGGFWITKVQLEMLLGELPGDREVGILGMQTATAAEVKRVLSRQDPQIEKFPVEEQDHIDYIVHLGALSRRDGVDHAWNWLSVRENSPIYRSLRRRHSQRTKKRAAGLHRRLPNHA